MFILGCSLLNIGLILVIKIDTYIKNSVKIIVFKDKYCLHILHYEYKTFAGDYCESVIPDPIPNSEVKPLSANGTLS